MVRNILAVVTGYISIFVAVFILFTLAFLVIGVEGSYQAGSWEVTGLWVVVSLVMSLAAAVAGGYICKLIAKNDKAVKILAGVALVLGLVMAVTESMTERVTEGRPAEVSAMEAGEKSVQPAWVGFVVTLLHVGGVLYGGKLKASGTADA